MQHEMIHFGELLAECSEDETPSVKEIADEAKEHPGRLILCVSDGLKEICLKFVSLPTAEEMGVSEEYSNTYCLAMFADKNCVINNCYFSNDIDQKTERFFLKKWKEYNRKEMAEYTSEREKAIKKYGVGIIIINGKIDRTFADNVRHLYKNENVLHNDSHLMILHSSLDCDYIWTVMAHAEGLSECVICDSFEETYHNVYYLWNGSKKKWRKYDEDYSSYCKLPFAYEGYFLKMAKEKLTKKTKLKAYRPHNCDALPKIVQYRCSKRKKEKKHEHHKGKIN